MRQGPIIPRLRLRRNLLWTAVGSLAVGAVVGVAALLFDAFNQVTSQVLLTLLALGFHCVIAMVLLGRMNIGRSALFSWVALAAFAAELAVLLIGIWFNRLWRDDGFFTLLFLCGAVLLARPGASILETRRGPPLLGWATVTAAAATFGLSLIALWNISRSDELARCAGTALVVSFTLSQFSFLFATGSAQVQSVRGLLIACIVTAAIVAAGLCGLIWDAFLMQSETMARLLGAVGVVDVCSSLVLVVMARLHGTPAEVADVSSVREVWLRCPRCNIEQTVTIGGGACEACGLRIEVRVEATDCVKCGYALANLPDRVCPECGTGF